MEFKLEIIKINKDIITTSATCSNAGGFVVYTDEGWYYYSNDSDTRKELSDFNSSFNSELLTTGKIYHVDKDGNILINDVCTCEELEDAQTAHGNEFTNACLAKGTKITMADYSLINVEDIKVGDMVLTFNHETGKYEGQKLYLVYKGENKANKFTLHFDNGNTISLVGEHDLFEKESLKYVTIYESNAEQFIGKHFYSAADKKYLELVAITHENEAVDFYSLYIKQNYNCIANGMFSLSDDVDWTLNIYKFNEDLTADLDELASDINKYGIFDTTSLKLLNGKEFKSERAKYVNVAIGKGLLTQEKWEENFRDFSATEWE